MPPVTGLGFLGFLGEQVDPATHERNGTVVALDPSLTTHGVIVGMTGSGKKTGPGVVPPEEALLADVPTLIIDPGSAGSAGGQPGLGQSGAPVATARSGPKRV